MILFNIPLLSPDNTNDYETVLRNLKLTLQSVLDQTNTDWFVSIGCNDTKINSWIEKFFPSEKIQVTQVTQEFHRLKQPIRSQINSVYSEIFKHNISENLFPRRNLDDGMHDKAFKRLLSYFDVEVNYDYIFFLDADDIVSNNLVEILSNQTSDLILLSNGYMVNLENREYKLCEKIHEYCGSTIAYSKELMENIPLNKMLLYLGGHHAQKNAQPTYLDEPLLIYRIHKYNFSGELWKKSKSNLLNYEEDPFSLTNFPSIVPYLDNSITAVTVSIDFGDFLATTLPINRPYFDKYIVVTSSSDTYSQKIAKENDCEVIITDRHKKNGAGFNKGCAINDGIKACQSTWICHLDADIVLKEKLKFEHDSIVGINRLMCESYDDWNYYRSTGMTDRFHKKDEQEGLKLAKMPPNKEYVIGYCQVWNTKMGYNYPEDSSTTTFSDLHFNDNFQNVKNLDISCIHLSANKWKRDIDYKGRKSPKWEPSDLYFISQMKSPQDKKQTYRNGIMQIWITRACDKSCFGCTQGSNLRGPYERITPEQFEIAVKSLKNYWGVIGIFGGNPCVHPQFPEICDILKEHVPFEQRGLWSNNLNGHGKLCSNIFNPKVSNINTHRDERAFAEVKENWPQINLPNLKDSESCSRHSPPFVAIQDVISDETERWKMINKCDINEFWSGMIGTFRGKLRGWFCEIAGAQSILHQYEEDYPDTGCEITLGWWDKPIVEFAEQVRLHCHACGIPLRIAGKLDDSTNPEQVSLTHSNIYKPKHRGVQIIDHIGQIQLNNNSPVTDYIKKNTVLKML